MTTEAPNDATVGKVKRATRACDQCRRLKEKCEGGTPCKRCAHFRRQCEFKNTASHGSNSRANCWRSRESNASTRELHQRLMYMETILKHQIEGISLSTNSLRRMANDITGESNHNAETCSDTEGEHDIEEESCTMDPVKETTTHFSGEFSYWNFSMRIKRHLEDRMDGISSPSFEDPDMVSQYWRAKQLYSNTSNLSTAMSYFPPSNIAEFLVKTFFKYSERRYFYVEKGWFEEKMRVLYADPANCDQIGASVISIILTVFAIGTQYAYLDSPTRNIKVNQALEFSEDEVGNTYYQQALRLLPEIIESSSLESVQACLLLGIYVLPIDASGLGYIYINLAIRLGMQNGMHRKCARDAFSPNIIETRNRVWWSAYMLERKISIFHGRPLSVLRSDVETDLPQDKEEIKWEGSTSDTECMRTAIHLIHQLEDFHNDLSSLRNCKRQEIPSIVSRISGRKTKLQLWWAALPEEQRVEDPQQQAQFRSNMHLRLESCLIRMLVARPFLFRRGSSRRDHNSPENDTPRDVRHSPNNARPGHQKRTSARQELIDDCMLAAKESLEICKSLRESGPGLARASYIEYSSCRASLLVLIAYSIQYQSDDFRVSLRDGLDLIRDMSAAGDSARSEISLIESFERALSRLNLLGSQDSMPAPLTSEYDQFKCWESSWKRSGKEAPTTGNSLQISPNQPTRQPISSVSHIRPVIIDSNFHDWPMETPNYSDRDGSFGVHSNYQATTGLGRPYDFTAGDAFFNGESLPSPSKWPAALEAQVYEEFASVPDFRFDTSVGNGTEFIGSSFAHNVPNHGMLHSQH